MLAQQMFSTLGEDLVGPEVFRYQCCDGSHNDLRKDLRGILLGSLYIYYIVLEKY